MRRKDAKQSEEERRALEEKEARERDIRVKFSLMGKGTPFDFLSIIVKVRFVA